MIYKKQKFILNNIEIKNKNFSTPKYHWNNLDKKKKDTKYLNKIYEKFLHHLSLKLNKIHDTNFSKDYWRIILGPWLNIYISSTFDRYSILKEFLHKKNFFTYHSYKFDYFENNNFFAYLNKVHNSEYYNLKIFDKIIKYFFINKVKIVEKKTLFQKSEKSKKFIFINKIESFLKKIFFIILSYYKKNIFFTTFFSKKSFFKIKNLIGSSCNLYFFFNFYNCFDNNQYNLEYRKKLLLNFNSSNKFEEFLKLNLFIEIPMSYLETYNEIKKIVKQSNLRKQKIITTVEYTMDDFYKIWIAEKKKYGSKIYIYDHSNSLRCNFFDYNHDFIISKKIISNLKIKNSHYINLPEIKFSINKSKYLNKDGKKISIIMYEGPKYTGKCISAPTSLTNYQLFKQLLIFYSKLNFKIKKNVKFKSPPYSNERFGTHSKIKKILGDSKIYDYRDKMVNVIKDSKLLICTYPQTSFLEILISEKPFILLISKKHWMFDKFGEKLISKLIKSNLLFTNELLAARHINKISENINKWWDSKENQKNLSYLKSNYFNFNINTSNSWRKFLSK